MAFHSETPLSRSYCTFQWGHLVLTLAGNGKLGWEPMAQCPSREVDMAAEAPHIISATSKGQGGCDSTWEPCGGTATAEETGPAQEGQLYDAAKGPWRLGCSEGEPLPSCPHLPGF